MWLLVIGTCTYKYVCDRKNREMNWVDVDRRADTYMYMYREEGWHANARLSEVCFLFLQCSSLTSVSRPATFKRQDTRVIHPSLNWCLSNDETPVYM